MNLKTGCKFCIEGLHEVLDYCHIPIKGWFTGPCFYRGKYRIYTKGNQDEVIGVCGIHKNSLLRTGEWELLYDLRSN